MSEESTEGQAYFPHVKNYKSAFPSIAVIHSFLPSYTAKTDHSSLSSILPLGALTLKMEKEKAVPWGVGVVTIGGRKITDSTTQTPFFPNSPLTLWKGYPFHFVPETL